MASITLNRTSAIFYLLLFGFALNTITVYQLNITVYNKIAVIFFLFLFWIAITKRSSSIPGKFAAAGFFLLLFCDALKNGFYISSLYDITQAGGAALTLYLLSDTRIFRAKIKFIQIFFVFAFALYAPVFFGVDLGQIYTKNSLMDDDIESIRAYHSGLFEVPHIAAYIFYYVAISSLYIILNRTPAQRTAYWWPILFTSIAIVLFSGSRTPVYAAVFSIATYLLTGNRKTFILGLTLISCGFFFYSNPQLPLSLFEGTILFQYVSLVQTLASNTERLSRVMIWAVFFDAIRDFSPIDYIVGRGFESSLNANYMRSGLRIWFHNDFLGVFYSYGALGLILYSSGFIAFYNRYRRVIHSDILSFTAFFSLVFFAFANGLYYYYAPLLILLATFIIARDNTEQTIENDLKRVK